MMSRCAAARMLITGAILPGCPTPATTTCAQPPATVAACAGGDEVLLDCWLHACEAQVEIACEWRQPCAAVALQVRLPCAGRAGSAIVVWLSTCRCGCQPPRHSLLWKNCIKKVVQGR